MNQVHSTWVGALHLGSQVSYLGSQVPHLGSCLSHLGSQDSHLRSQVSHLGSRLSHLGSCLSHLGSQIFFYMGCPLWTSPKGPERTLKLPQLRRQQQPPYTKQIRRPGQWTISSFMVIGTNVTNQGLALVPYRTLNPIDYNITGNFMLAHHTNDARASCNPRDISPLLVLNFLNVPKIL